MENKNLKTDIDRLVSALRRKEPVLQDPGQLTDDIMRSIMLKAETGKIPAKQVSEKPGRRIAMVARLLAAASVCLFMVFGYEQYVVVDKIGKLERQNAAISQNAKYGPAMKINEVIAFIKSDPKLLNRYKTLNEEKGNKLSLLKAAILFDVLMIAGNDSIHQNIQK